MPAAQIIIAVALRLLTCAPDFTVIASALALIQRARQVVYAWLHQLMQELNGCCDSTLVPELRIRLCEAAATCRSTYDVEERFMQGIFMSRENLATLITCAVVLYENLPPVESLAKLPSLQLLLDYDRRLAFSVEESVAFAIRSSALGLDDALQDAWPTYCPGSQWLQLSAPNERWFTSTTSGPASQRIHLNILSGCFLVDGRGVSRLPKTVTDGALYKRVFGSVSHLLVQPVFFSDIRASGSLRWLQQELDLWNMLVKSLSRVTRCLSATSLVRTNCVLM